MPFHIHMKISNITHAITHAHLSPTDTHESARFAHTRSMPTTSLLVSTTSRQSPTLTHAHTHTHHNRQTGTFSLPSTDPLRHLTPEHHPAPHHKTTSSTSTTWTRRAREEDDVDFPPKHHQNKTELHQSPTQANVSLTR
uniref:Uncharacterized protein n=1 Tax=Schistosoma mansoni TaxID=6183 RepID=A0A3Q0KU41_SCHMA